MVLLTSLLVCQSNVQRRKIVLARFTVLASTSVITVIAVCLLLKLLRDVSRGVNSQYYRARKVMVSDPFDVGVQDLVLAVAVLISVLVLQNVPAYISGVADRRQPLVTAPVGGRRLAALRSPGGTRDGAVDGVGDVVGIA